MRPSTARRLFYLLTLAPPAAIAAAVALQPWADPRWAFMDPVTAADISGEVHLYYGFVSNLGVLYMAVSAAVALFAGACLLALRAPAGPVGFLLVGGFVSGWIALDDLFLVHEALLPKAGLRQELAVGLTGLFILAHVAAGRRRILAHEWPLMAAALCGFALSVGIDLLAHSVQGPAVVLEDAAKFVGMAAWTGFHAHAALLEVLHAGRPALQAQAAAA